MKEAPSERYIGTVLNHLMLLQSKVAVVNDKEKTQQMRKVKIRETKETKPLFTHRENRNNRSQNQRILAFLG